MKGVRIKASNLQNKNCLMLPNLYFPIKDRFDILILYILVASVTVSKR